MANPPDRTPELATQIGRLPDTDVVLLGTFGTEAAPGALLRLRSGKEQRVALGAVCPAARSSPSTATA